MRGNTIELQLEEGKVTVAGSLYQYDYGQRLILLGVELPVAYEVHFSNDTFGNSKTSIGDASGVDIPDEYLLNGNDIHVWLFLHEGESDGETEYHGILHVVKRAQPTDQAPTPVQQSAIDQAIAALHAAVAQCEADVEKYPVVIEGYWCVWDEETQQYVSTGAKAKGDKGDPGDPGAPGMTPNLSVGTVSTLQPGSDVTFTITGTAENPVVNVGIPQGAKGDPGDLSSSDIATEAETQDMIDDYYGGDNP